MNKAALVLPFILTALLVAIWSGWLRIGLSLPVNAAAAHHGSFMINGFLASVIFLERSVIFRNRLMLLLPLLNVVSIFAYASGLAYSGYIHLVCCAGYLVLCIYFTCKYKALYYYVFLSGAFSLLMGNMMLYKTQMYPAALIWWMLFLLLTIVAERLELSRFLPLNNFKKGLLLLVLSCALLAAFLPFHTYGNVLFSCALFATASWLLKYDMAFKSIKARGQHRYSGLLLITGYAWLMVTAILFLFWDKLNFGYDAVVHSYFIGFVFSMIFSHAPIILPAVTKIPVKVYRPVMYVWFALLQVSLMTRLLSGFFEMMTIRKISGLLNGIAIVLFFATIAVVMRAELAKRNRLQKS